MNLALKWIGKPENAIIVRMEESASWVRQTSVCRCLRFDYRL